MAITKRSDKGSALTYNEMDDNFDAIAPRTSETGAIQIPAGTTGERPTGQEGHLRFNTASKQFEGFQGTTWSSIGGAGGGGGGSPGIQGVQGTDGNAGPAGNPGLQGSTGDPGLEGDPGPQGITGSTGDEGQQGDPGIQGPAGSVQGLQGTSGFQGTTGLGIQGTTGSGSDGDPGAQGIQGAAGSTQGVQGLRGPDGSDGFGNQGTTGAQGPAGSIQGLQGTIGPAGFGAQGIQGIQGIEGEVGEDGPAGLQGADGAGAQGTDGFQGFQGTDGFQGNDGFGLQGLQGQLGNDGPQGVQGDLGLQGQTGTGADGVQGPIGVQGFAGDVQGVQGSTGAGQQGTQGILGPIGIQGNFGPSLQGIQGQAGSTQGFTGTIGPDGIQGIQGTQGLSLQGEQGLQGQPGTDAAGFQGTQGLLGNQGTQGSQGPTAFQGIQGFGGPGAVGVQGVQGNQGFVGEQGDDGGAGPIGPQGVQGVRGPIGDTGDAGSDGAGGLQGLQGTDGTLSNIVDDTSPQLGGNLDINSKKFLNVNPISFVEDVANPLDISTDANIQINLEATDGSAYQTRATMYSQNNLLRITSHDRTNNPAQNYQQLAIRPILNSSTLQLSSVVAGAATNYEVTTEYNAMTHIAQNMEYLSNPVRFNKIDTTARDALTSQAEGNMIYNTTTDQVEIYNGSGWENIAVPSIDDNGNATAITIDASETVLVGKTVDTTTTPGTALYNNGQIYATVAGSHPMVLTRNTDDGAIAIFYKDTTEVGRVGVDSGDNLTVSGSVANHGGLYMGTNTVIPMSGGVATTGTVSLGNTGTLWKDLYVSDGVYLGGTGVANKLDDYEEGSFSAALTATSSGTITLNSSYDTLFYTKIGNIVHFSGYIRIDSVSSPTGTIRFTLPFTVANLVDSSSAVLVYANGLASGSVSDMWAECSDNNPYVYIYAGGGTNVSGTSAQQTQAATDFRISGTYKTNA